MKKRLSLTCILCCLICACTVKPRSVSAADLGIGSDAPALDIEHWIQDGNGFFKPVKDFEKGKVYVIEFWATWCGPCISSMPHLAELQNKYRGRGVQLISVSDESLDEVKDLLLKENEKEGKTFNDITAAYSLTTDPDRSVHIDYMEAADQQGIPTSFIVGKEGVIEWIGHPMELDEPLEAVVTDSWDREKFQKEMEARQKLQETMQRVRMLAGAERFEDALKVVKAQVEEAEGTPIRELWMSVRNELKIMGGMIDDEVVAFNKAQLAKMKGRAEAVGQFGFSLYGAAQQGADIGPLAGDAIQAIEDEIEAADPALIPLMHNTVALLHNVTGKIDEAIKSQMAAIDAADDRQKRRLQPFLEQLKEKKEAADE